MAAGTHVIVIGNEKGGSGKSTTAIHLAVFLLHYGFRVASIDADSRQQTFTAYVRNRRAWADAHGLRIPHPTHYHLPLLRNDSAKVVQQREFELFREAVMDVEGGTDYLIIDTPGFDTHLARVAHSLADTLITPLNDSSIDLDVLCHMDPVTGEARELSHYAKLVLRARSERLSVDGRKIDWLLVRNRISMLNSRNGRQVHEGLTAIAQRLGARVADGIAERVIFRALFPCGLTVFDALDEATLAGTSAASHMSASEDYRRLVKALRLPLSERAAARQAAQSALKAQPDFDHIAPPV